MTGNNKSNRLYTQTNLRSIHVSTNLLFGHLDLESQLNFAGLCLVKYKPMFLIVPTLKKEAWKLPSEARISYHLVSHSDQEYKHLTKLLKFNMALYPEKISRSNFKNKAYHRNQNP